MNNFTSPGKGEKLASVLTFHTPSPQTCLESQMMLCERNRGLLLLCLLWGKHGSCFPCSSPSTELAGTPLGPCHPLCSAVSLLSPASHSPPEAFREGQNTEGSSRGWSRPSHPSGDPDTERGICRTSASPEGAGEPGRCWYLCRVRYYHAAATQSGTCCKPHSSHLGTSQCLCSQAKRALKNHPEQQRSQRKDTQQPQNKRHEVQAYQLIV